MAGRPRQRYTREGEEAAQLLLQEIKVSRPPIPVDRIATRLGARISFEPFDGNVSGLLHRGNGEIIIGVNATQPLTRQRFTIAHEIGHLRLHQDRLIVDKVVQTNFRDERSSLAIDSKEIQANAFAAELLMPRPLVIREVNQWASRHPNLDIERLAIDLAKTFNVSSEAMNHRLTNLGIRQLL